MPRILTTFVLAFLCAAAHAQTFGVNVRTKDGAAVSTNRIRVETSVGVGQVQFVNSFLQMNAVAAPAVAPAATGRIFFDTATNKFRASENGGVYVDLVGGGGGAPTGASYLTLALDGTLAAERVLTAGAGVSFTDTGANGTLTINNTGVTAVTASGVLSSSGGTTPNITLSGIVPIANGGTAASSVPANGQLLIGNGANYAVANLTAGTAISVTNGAGSITIANTGDTDPTNDITNTTVAGGDLSGTYPNPLVDGLQGTAVSATAPGAGQVLKFNGAAWAPGTDNDTTYTAGTGLSLAGTTFSLATPVSVANGGTGATTFTTNQFLWFDGTNVAASGFADTSFVKLAPAASQTDATGNASIFINKTGAAGNMLTLQKSGLDKLTLSNAANVLTFVDTANVNKYIRATLSPLNLEADTSVRVMLDKDANSLDTSELVFFTVRANDVLTDLFTVSELGNTTLIGTSVAQPELRLRELTTNGSEYIAHRSVAALGANTTYTWPAAPAAAGQILSSDTSGNLSWIASGGGGTVTSITAGTGLTATPLNPITTSGTINLANTAVTVGSYGSAGAVGTFTVDAQGRLTAASNTPIAIAASQITSGVLPVANGGTGTSTTFMTGSVVFAGAAGVYSQDNANLFWDDTNNRLGIGTTAPGQKLHASSSQETLGQFETTSSFYSARVWLKTPDSDGYLGAYGSGYGDPNVNSKLVLFSWFNPVNIYAANNQIQFTTGVPAVQKMVILNGGNVGIGIAAPTQRLDVQGGSINTSASLMTAGTARIDSSGMVTLGSLVADPAVTNGALYYNTGSAKLRGCEGGLWKDMIGGGGGTVTSITAGTGLTATPLNPITTSGTINLANTAVTVGSYGAAGTVGTFTVDAQGRLTAASNTPIAIAASQITSGVLPVANGGTGTSSVAANGQLPIGNGAGYTVANLTAGAGISITNGAGSITITNTGSGGAPTGASYLTLGLDATLTSERVLTAGTAISFSDTGANGSLTINNTGVTNVTASAPLASSGGTTPNISLGVVPIASGGTATSSIPANGQLPIGNGAGYTVANLTAGANITITNGAGSITIASTGGGGVSSLDYGTGAQTGPVTLPTSGTTNYIQRQFASAQTADFWINGNGRFQGDVRIGPNGSGDMYLRGASGASNSVSIMNPASVTAARFFDTTAWGTFFPAVEIGRDLRLLGAAGLGGVNTNNGNMTYDTTANRFRFRENGAWSELPPAPGVAGRILYDDGTDWVVLPIGTAGQVLTVSGGLPTWQTPSGGGGGGGTWNFDSGLGAWTVVNSSATVVWAADATPATVAGVSNSWVSAPNSLNYNNGTNFDDAATNNGTATSPNITLSATSTTLTFQCNYQTEDTGTTYDQRWVEISNDNFVTFLVQDQLSTTGLPLGGACAGMGTWHSHTYTLTPAWGTIKVRYRFNTIDGAFNAFSGWFVDDVVIPP